jgi:chromosome segregation ATPase
MPIRPLIIALPVAMALGLAACDSRDYEAELAELQTQLGDATSELETVRSENETLTTEMEELRTQAEAAPAGGGLDEEAAAAVRTELESALETASQTAERLAALERDPEAPAAARTAAVGVLRNDVETIASSVRAAADELGLELQAGVEPAAGPDEEAQSQPAGGQAQQTGQTEPPEEQPADEQTEPQQQQQ